MEPISTEQLGRTEVEMKGRNCKFPVWSVEVSCSVDRFGKKLVFVFLKILSFPFLSFLSPILPFLSHPLGVGHNGLWVRIVVDFSHVALFLPPAFLAFLSSHT
jgi:hypothetical protein